MGPVNFLNDEPGATAGAGSTPAKKKFSETGVGKFVADNGGIGGMLNMAVNLFGTIKRSKNKSGSGGSRDSGGVNYGPPPTDDKKILGMPPIAFGAVALVLVLVVVFAISSRGSAPASAA